MAKGCKRILPISCKQNFFWDPVLQECRVLTLVIKDSACLSISRGCLFEAKTSELGQTSSDSKLNISDSTHAGGVRAWWPQNYNWRSLWDPADIFQWNMWWECVDASWLFISYYSCISSLFILFIYICQWCLRGKSQDIYQYIVSLANLNRSTCERIELAKY